MTQKTLEKIAKLKRTADRLNSLAGVGLGVMAGGFLSDNSYVGFGGAAASVVLGLASYCYDLKSMDLKQSYLRNQSLNSYYSNEKIDLKDLIN